MRGLGVWRPGLGSRLGQWAIGEGSGNRSGMGFSKNATSTAERLCRPQSGFADAVSYDPDTLPVSDAPAPTVIVEPLTRHGRYASISDVRRVPCQGEPPGGPPPLEVGEAMIVGAA